MRYLLAATIAAALVLPSAAAACDSEKAAAHADAAGHKDCAAKCPHAKGAKPTLAKAAPGAATQALKASGKVVCARCELKTSDSCKSVFQQAETKTTYTLCDAAMTEQLLKLTRHGELDVTVHGSVTKTADGSDLLCVDGFSVGTI